MAGARRRRAPHLWPDSETPVFPDDVSTNAVVGTYDGCEEGRELWGVYRLARIDRPEPEKLRPAD
ncbi:hypothetical protein QQY66_16260 [Streptomyces sp. DG2A-72]|uniref:hypothetical protein n=1 Tax=Streptomyces sp. DG2A-72 TaxID=3051386 RepID=UPI00265C631B|nr:hypothetical protein [Streptomyces sp. DG2A-72]MDO0933170.1 hypothetical protein [Streptomyces sp. DG2A-72]